MSGEHENFIPPDHTIVQTLQQKVEATIGHDFSSLTDPSDEDLSSYLRQGVLDIIERILELKPDEAVLYAKTWFTDSNRTITKSNLGKIVGVTREAGVKDDWRPCRYIDKSFISRVTDSTSIYYASKFNPVYTIGNTFIEVYPEPDNEDDRFRVASVNNFPQDSNGGQLKLTSFDVGYFPKNKVYLIILYASIKSLDKLIAVAHDNLPSNLTISITIPVLPAISDNSFTFSETAPQYVSPNISLASKPSISDLSISVTAPSVPSIIINNSSLSSAPQYIAPTVSPNFSDADTWINTEEDPEMVASRVQVIQSQLQKYGSDIQNAQAKFQEEMAEYQQEFQKSTTNAQLSSKRSELEVNKYSQLLSQYTQDVNKQVQQYQNNLQKELKLFELDRGTVIQRYNADIQNALNKFNKENTEYQILFNKELQNATIKSKDDDQKIQKYSSELQKYAADINKEVQQFQSNLQKVKMDIEIYQARGLKLQKEYDDAFIFMAPKKQQQESRGK
tara:strand:+ start:1099 stop:2613 length:1515 start_codon:yes stop_codon:yes gene_type:complete